MADRRLSYLGDEAEAAVADAAARPLSRKAALYAVLCLDRLAEGLFRARGAGDPLAFRTCLREADNALALILDLAELRLDGPSVILAPDVLEPRDYATLAEPEYMISLYNGGQVERVKFKRTDGTLCDPLPVLRAALLALQHQLA